MQVCTIILEKNKFVRRKMWSEKHGTTKSIHQYDINFKVAEDCGIEMLIWLGFKKGQPTFNIVQHALLLKYITILYYYILIFIYYSVTVMDQYVTKKHINSAC